ncbi:MAG TPA: hypothetical protein VN372_03695 [Methanospirillum sp.]|nr:hypothetical protein [Methanospirillum sp.]
MIPKTVAIPQIKIRLQYQQAEGTPLVDVGEVEMRREELIKET